MTGPSQTTPGPWPKTGKAQTLAHLAPRVTRSRVAPLCVATLSALRQDASALAKSIAGSLKAPRLAVRSSHSGEDQESGSMAGKFLTVLNVPRTDTTALVKALHAVADSYGKETRGSEEILIQEMVEDVASAGVVFTREILTGSPYYVVSLEEGGRTDGVTGGRVGGTLYLSRLLEIPSRWNTLIAAVREVETLLGQDALDIEVALGQDGTVHLLQARPLRVSGSCDDKALEHRLRSALQLVNTLSAPQPHLVGRSTVFGNMPDWNPAEILGDHPRPLDLSLYRHLVTDGIWQKARRSLGYLDVAPAPLLRTILGRPYMDVRLSLNSFLPATLPRSVAEALVEEALERLRAHPELQDKIEFELTVTCHRFDMPAHLARVATTLSPAQRGHLAASLTHLTREVLASFSTHLRSDLGSISELGSRRQRLLGSAPKSPLEGLHAARLLIDDCRERGTLPFARLARLAFIGKTLLVSACEAGLVKAGEVEDFLRGLSTVAGHMEEDGRLLALGKLPREDFLARYGHLRPGTYDITAASYAEDPTRLGSLASTLTKAPGSGMSPASMKALDKASQGDLGIGAGELLSFIKLALEAREDAKFEFTRNLSAALELIRTSLHSWGISREEAAFLEIQDLAIERLAADPAGPAGLRALAQTRRERRAEESLLRVPPVIRGAADISCVTHPASRPNFVGSKMVRAKPLLLEGAQKESPRGRIVLIRSADPGWDWIFTHEPAGLVTEYGGVASHMAIRCAEFGLSAAIGCGHDLFGILAGLPQIELDPAGSRVGAPR